MNLTFHRIVLIAAMAIVAGGCATQAPVVPNSVPTSAAESGIAARPEPQSVLRSIAIDRALEARIMALDPERISADDVQNTLAKGPAPHIVLVHGGIYPVYLAMVSTGRFLTGMGYPENRIRHPGDRRWSHSPYENSAQIAGLVAWYYEHDGMRPMMIGHSQGGVQAVRVLYDLAGRFGDAVRVWNPLTDDAEERTSIVDPLTGVLRPVVGVSVSYVSVVGAGGAALMLPNQWNMAGKLHTIPDTVDEFTGFSIPFDLIAWTLPGVKETTQFRHNGTAVVRSIVLPATYNHVTVPIVHPLARDKATRDWIEAYSATDPRVAPPPEDAGNGLFWAADVWHSVKKHWALEAQRFVRARAALGAPP